MKVLKRMLALLLVSCLLFCVAPSTFAAENGVATIEESNEGEDIRDNPIAAGALKDIIAAFAESFIEIITRYVQAIVKMIQDYQNQNQGTPEIPDVPTDPTPDTPVDPDTDVDQNQGTEPNPAA